MQDTQSMQYNLPANSQGFVSWLPSTWPTPPSSFTPQFADNLDIIVRETILDEIANVISDAKAQPSGLQHRGHVIALAMLCAVDALAGYTDSRKFGKKVVVERYTNFIQDFFPTDYRPFAKEIYNQYRNYVVHNWNIFEVVIYPGHEKIADTGGCLSFGLLHFFDALQAASSAFIAELKTNPILQHESMTRYKELRNSAKPLPNQQKPVGMLITSVMSARTGN